MKKFFFFDSMVSPKIITALYWILLLLMLSVGLDSIFAEGKILKGLGYIIGGSLFIRVFCEILIVIFKINDNIQKLVDKTGS